MANEILPATTPVATTQATSPAPSPAVVEVAAPLVNTQTVTENAPVTTDPAKTTESPKPAETVLGAEPQKDPVKSPEAQKPTDVKVDASVEIKKEDGKQSDEPAPLPTYEAFKLPEGITLEGNKLSEFTKDLGEFQTRTKAEQAAVQEFGQKLVDRHIAEVNSTVKRLNEHYTQAWEKQKIEWKDAFVKDPEIGGNRQETTVNAALQFIKTHGGNEAQQQEFRQLMETTGIGNHPAMIRLLAKANMNMAEGKPLPAAKPVPTATSKVAKRYGDSV